MRKHYVIFNSNAVVELFKEHSTSPKHSKTYRAKIVSAIPTFREKYLKKEDKTFFDQPLNQASCSSESLQRETRLFVDAENLLRCSHSSELEHDEKLTFLGCIPLDLNAQHTHRRTTEVDRALGDGLLTEDEYSVIRQTERVAIIAVSESIESEIQAVEEAPAETITPCIPPRIHPELIEPPVHLTRYKLIHVPNVQEYQGVQTRPREAETRRRQLLA